MAAAAASSFKNLEMVFTPGHPRFRPNNPFWIDNVRASLAALDTMNSAKRLLKC